ncbi:spore germination protein [Rossellomorea sp. BNER]|uniref:spore germination protein n=1 Tax=Rossellomorea sp. BNER TaxID=2962031 RepID=UPI003AF3073D
MPSFFKKRKQKGKRKNQHISESNSSVLIDRSLDTNIETIKKKTGNSSDIVIRTIQNGIFTIKTAIIYVEGIVDDKSIRDFLIDSLMNDPDILEEDLTPQNALDIISNQVVAIGVIQRIDDWDELLSHLMSGNTIILVDGVSVALSASTQGGEKRAIEEPSTQMAVRGSRAGFTESIGTNTALIRRIIKNPDLWLESMQIGRVTRTDVSIMYINGIANEEIIKEVKERLNRIDIDSILESGYIEQLIEDKTMTTFPTIYHTERPDMVAGNLLEGRIAIFVDGTPFVLLAPVVFMQFFQSAEDYYARFDIASAIRLLRILIFIISLIAPAVYIGATTYHQEMIPTKLLVAIAAQREVIPFPAFVEAIIMEIAFEILREAGIRMPKAIGSAVSIVGALVIGQAAVQAGIVSPAMVIIVAITAIASFATPSFAIAISARLIRFMFMLSSAVFGFYGIILGIIFMLVHLCSLRSFGIPYMSPLAPFIPSNTGDTLIRVPWWAFKERPRLISQQNVIREGKNQKPQPPESQGIKIKNTTKGDQNES